MAGRGDRHDEMKILASWVLFRPADYQRSLSSYRDAIGLAITREYGSGTVFYAGQSLIELASHGAPAESGGPFPGVLWLQVRDAYATQAELEGRGCQSRPGREAQLASHATSSWVVRPGTFVRELKL